MIPRRYRWALRAAVYALVGILTFVTQPPGATAVAAQFAGYLAAGVGLLAWQLLDLLPSAALPARVRARTFRVVLGVVAAAAGFAAGAGLHENNCAIMLTGLAAIAAGYGTEPPAAWAITASGILAFEANLLIYPDGYVQLSTFLLQPLGPITGLLFGQIVRARQIQAQQSAALLDRTRQLQEQERRADVLGERARIAREIHDVLAHSLGALGIQIQTARAVLTDQHDIDRAIEALVTAQRMAADGMAETRRAVHALRADVGPLDSELGRLADSHGDHHDVGVSFDIGGVPRPLPPDATVALLRTAQEALVNAAKHAAGLDVAVRLDYGGLDVQLTVINDLAACRTSAPVHAGTADGGYGLTGMRERLRLLNGALVAGPRDGRWAVTAVVPLAPAPQP